MTDSKVEPSLLEKQYPNYDYDPTYYDPAEVDDEIGRLRPDESEERTSWGYLGLLCVVFLGLVVSAQACEALEEESPVTEVVTDETGVSITSPVRLTAEVNGDLVTLRGSVPDEAARAELVSIAESVYNSANLIDELTVDPETTLEGGSIAVTGVASEDDERPNELRDAVTEAFDIEDGGVAVDRNEEGALLPVSVDGFTEAGSVRLSGALPDQESLDNLVAAAEAAWGANAVDAAGLTIDERTWTEGQIRITGTVPPGTSNHTTFVSEAQSRLGQEVTIDVAGISTDLSDETLSTLEAEIQEAVTANPILFAPQSSELDPASEAVLNFIAQQLRNIPEIRVEIVGHTDNQGPEDENLVLSQQRAEAVQTRLIELGIDAERLNARGEGEQFPLVEEDTPEAWAQNRRIEFNLIAG